MGIGIHRVSTLAVEWIEIWNTDGNFFGRKVSTLAVEWIEIGYYGCCGWCSWVSTLAVEWIEIRDKTDPEIARDIVSTLAVEWIEIPFSSALIAIS